MKIEQSTLVGSWTHSHEEDAHGEMVFRGATYSFPLSRGRRSIHLAAGGKLMESHPGATDRTERAEGSWSLDGNQLTLTLAGASTEKYVVSSADRNRLVLRQAVPPS
jgi:lipocalin-like protein